MTRQDIFRSDAEILVCPVNGVGVLGAGLAMQFRNRVDGLEAFYKDCCKRGFLKPGDVQWYYDIDSGKQICLFPTKRHFRDRSRLDDIDAGLIKLQWWLDWFGESYRVAMPRIACGLGGQQWQDVKPLIEKRLNQKQIVYMEP